MAVASACLIFINSDFRRNIGFRAIPFMSCSCCPLSRHESGLGWRTLSLLSCSTCLRTGSVRSIGTSSRTRSWTRSPNRSSRSSGLERFAKLSMYLGWILGPAYTPPHGFPSTHIQDQLPGEAFSGAGDVTSARRILQPRSP